MRPVVRPVANGAPDQAPSLTAWLLDNLIIHESSSEAQHYHRDAHHLRAEDRGYLRLRIYRSGSTVWMLGETPYRTVPGNIYVTDFSRPMRQVIQRSSILCITVSHDAIGCDPARHAPHISFALGSPAGRLLGDAVFNLAGQLPHIRQSEAPALAAGLGGLLRGLVLREPPGEDARQAAMRRRIERNLHDLDLGVESLCRAFGVSRATLYREFATEGGIARYITRRRLDWTFRELACHPPARGRANAGASCPPATSTACSAPASASPPATR